MTADPITIDLNARRKRLGMSCRVVAELTGVSLATVQRVMQGRYDHATVGNLRKIADAMGVRLDLTAQQDAQTLREQQAERKARELVAMVQATSALEAQAVGSADMRRMVDRTKHELLRSNRRLWSP